MSGGSFDYLYNSEAPASSSAWDAMRHELVLLGADDIVAKMDAVTDALATLGQPYSSETGTIRDVWHAIEWWRSGDSGINRVRAAVLAYREKHPRVVEREVEFAPVDALSDRERACLRGEHADSGAWVSAREGALFSSESGSPDRGLHIRVCVCAHCRAVFVPRSP